MQTSGPREGCFAPCWPQPALATHTGNVALSKHAYHRLAGHCTMVVFGMAAGSLDYHLCAVIKLA